MFKKIKNVTLSLILALGLASVFVPAAVQAQSTIADNICTGVLNASGDEATDASSCEEDGENSFSTIITRVINIFSILIGSISVIMIIIGGFRYIISGGDQNNVTAAKNTIMYAIIGLVVVLFSQVIVRFVLTNAVSKN
jgi:hypothetical protein